MVEHLQKDAGKKNSPIVDRYMGRWVSQKQGDFLSPPFELGLFGKELGVITAN